MEADADVGGGIRHTGRYAHAMESNGKEAVK